MLSRLSTWDAATCHRVNAINRLRAGSALFAAASRLGDGAVWYALMLALPCCFGLEGLYQSLLMAANGAACTACYTWIKGRTRRPRPMQVHATLLITVAPLDRFSFPSGHTLHAVAFTVLAVHFHPGLLWALAPFTALVAMSRVVLGLHYPSDVGAGAAIGAGMSAVSITLGEAILASPPA